MQASPPILHSAPAPTRWATDWPGETQGDASPPISTLLPQIAGGILIHLRFGQNTAYAHLFFHLSFNNAMNTLCVETVVSTCLARDCPPAVCLAHCLCFSRQEIPGPGGGYNQSTFSKCSQFSARLR